MAEIIDPRPPKLPPKTARECPFGSTLVPNVDVYTGKQDKKVPWSMLRGACTDSCALYDVEKGRNCLERVLAAKISPAFTVFGGVAPNGVVERELPPIIERRPCDNGACGNNVKESHP